MSNSVPFSLILLIFCLISFSNAVYANEKYEQCVSTVIDGHLASKPNQIEQYTYAVLPGDEGFGGQIIYKSGSVIRINEKEEPNAIYLLSQMIAGHTDELDMVDLRSELGEICVYQ